MAQVNYDLPTIGQPNATEDVDVRNALSAIKTQLNGNLDETNMAPAADLTEEQLDLTYGEAPCTVDVSTGITDTDITGTSRLLDPGSYLIHAHWNIDGGGTGVSTVTGKLFVGGVANAAQVPVVISGIGAERKTVSLSWLITFASATTVKMSAIRVDTSGANTMTIRSSHSRWTYLKVA